MSKQVRIVGAVFLRIVFAFPWESRGTNGIAVFPIPMHISRQHSRSTWLLSAAAAAADVELCRWRSRCRQQRMASSDVETDTDERQNVWRRRAAVYSSPTNSETPRNLNKKSELMLTRRATASV